MSYLAFVDPLVAHLRLAEMLEPLVVQTKGILQQPASIQPAACFIDHAAANHWRVLYFFTFLELHRLKTVLNGRSWSNCTMLRRKDKLRVYILTWS